MVGEPIRPLFEGPERRGCDRRAAVLGWQAPLAVLWLRPRPYVLRPQPELAGSVLSVTDSVGRDSRIPSRAALSPKRAAEYLDCNEGTLAKWRYEGVGPPYLKIGSKVLYRVESLDIYLQDREDATMREHGPRS